MPNSYQVKIIRLPLPRGPLVQGHPEPERHPIGRVNEFSTNVEALRYALALQDEGYGAAIVDPEGNEWINIKERAIQIFQAERASLITQLQAFETTHRTTDPTHVMGIRNNIAELDQYLRSL
jgi:hypothetical protein